MPKTKIRWVNWQPEKVKESIKEQIAVNMEVACQFVQTEAIRNLRAITDPRRGKFYRRVILPTLMAHEVEVGKNFVEGRIGVRVGPKPGKPYGLYIEIGTSQYPANPFLRPAVFNNAAEILDILR